MDWRANAACRDEDPELFFPLGDTGPALLQIEDAKAVCKSCAVVSDCLAWALESGQDSGIWAACPKRSDALCAGAAPEPA